MESKASLTISDLKCESSFYRTVMFLEAGNDDVFKSVNNKSNTEM